MAWVIGTVTSVFGTLIAGPIRRIWAALFSKQTELPAAKATDRSIAAAGDVSGQVAIGDQSSQQVIIMQAGSTLNMNTNANVSTYTTFAAGKPSSAGGAEESDAYQEGVQCQKDERHAEAIRQFERAFARAKSDSERRMLHSLIGNSYLAMGLFQEAEGHYLEARDFGDETGKRNGK